jgi:hypothetical protein
MIVCPAIKHLQALEKSSRFLGAGRHDFAPPLRGSAFFPSSRSIRLPNTIEPAHGNPEFALRFIAQCKFLLGPGKRMSMR